MDWQLFFSIYLLIFLAELPDKTAFATLLLATKNSAVSVLIGVALAFFIQTIVAVVFGSVLALFPEKWVHLGAGLLFLGFAFQMWRQRNEAEDETCTNTTLEVSFWRSTWNAFIVIFIAEWGDLTQIATASLVAKYDESKFTVFMAALLALWSVSLVAVFLGHRAKKLIHPAVLKRICAFVFLGIGLYFVATFF